MVKGICFFTIKFVFFGVSIFASTPLFDTPVSYNTGDGPASVFAVDLDGDSARDLVTANAYGNSVSILMNLGNGTFASHLDDPVVSNPFAIYASDLDGDGDQDLAIVHQGGSSVSVLKNDGQESSLFHLITTEWGHLLTVSQLLMLMGMVTTI